MKMNRMMLVRSFANSTLNCGGCKAPASFLVLVFLIFFINIGVVSAANLGISPASVEFKNVLRDGYSERWVVISVDSEDSISVEIEPRGEIKNWLNFSERNFSVSKNNPYYLGVFVNPPVDIPNGNYSGFLRVKTGQMGEGIEEHVVGIVRSTLDLIVKVEITDIEIRDCSVSSVKVDSAEKGDDVIFYAKVKNNGNIKLKPILDIDIWDSDQISVIKNEEFYGDNILPTTEGNVSLRVKSDDLEIGQYWADFLALDCYFSQTLTFDILEEGALKAAGRLLEIITRKNSKVGETVPIIVKFKNIGEKEVEAQFKGKINRGDKIIQILESEKIRVPISSGNDFNFYFTPERSGKYVISGRVFYSGKKTFESSAVLEVVSEDFEFSSLIGLIYVFFIVLIFYLIYKIRKERQLYSRKLRRIKNDF